MEMRQINQETSLYHATAHQTHFDPYQKQLDKVSQDVKSSEPTCRPQLLVISGLPGIGKALFASRLAKRLQGTDSSTTTKIHIPKGASHQDVAQDIASNVLDIRDMNDALSCCLREEFLTKLEKLKFKTVILCFGVTNAVEEEQRKILSLTESLVSNPNVTVLMTARKRFEFPRLGQKFYPYDLQPPGEEEARRFLEPFLGPYMLSVHARETPDSYPEAYVPVLPFIIGKILKKCGQYPELVPQVGIMLKDNDPVVIIWDSIKHYTGGQSGEDALKCLKFQADRKFLSALAEVDGPFNQDTYCALTGKDASQSGLAVRSIRPWLSSHFLATTGSGSERTFCMNELIKDALHQKWGHLDGWVENRNRFCLFYAQLMQRMTPLMHSYHPQNLPLFQADYANLQKLLEKATFAISEDFMYEVIMEIAHNSQEIIYDYFQKKEVVPFYKSCVRAAQQRCDERRLAYVLIALSHAVLMLIGNFDQLEEYLSEAQDILERIGEMNTLDSARLHLEKGWYQYKCAKHYEALRCYQEARRILIHLITGEDGNVGPQNPMYMYLLEKAKTKDNGGLLLWVLSSVDTNIATIHTCTGAFETSVGCFKQNLQLQNAVWTERHPHSALTNHKLGLTYLLYKDFANACRYGTKGLNLRMLLTKGASHTTIQSLSMVAMAILDDTGDWQRSLRLLQEAIEMRQELGPNHPDMGLLHHGMGNIYRFSGNHGKAQEHYQLAADIRETAYGMGPNFCTLESLDALADTCVELGETEKALELQEKCLKMLSQHLFQRNAEGHLIEDDHVMGYVRTACRKIGLIYEAMDGCESQADIWKNASEAERPLDSSEVSATLKNVCL